MENLDISVDEAGLLVIRVDLNKTIGESKSGASEIICRSGGNLRLYDANGFRTEILNMSVSRRRPGARRKAWV